MSNPDPGPIETCTGREFHLVDVAAGLAHTCRFGGHCQRFYSVAEHSLHVASELDDRGPRVQLYGLLHDAEEACLVDVQARSRAPGETRQAFVERAEALLDSL